MTVPMGSGVGVWVKTTVKFERYHIFVIVSRTFTHIRTLFAASQHTRFAHLSYTCRSVYLCPAIRTHTLRSVPITVYPPHYSHIVHKLWSRAVHSIRRAFTRHSYSHTIRTLDTPTGGWPPDGRPMAAQ